MSVWPVAIQMRALEEIGIIDAPEPAAPAPARPHRKHPAKTATWPFSAQAA
jgi:hypothetical protein